VPDDERKTDVERLLGRSLEGTEPEGHRLSARARQTQRSVETYLRAGIRPRWMERLLEIEQGMTAARRRLERSYRTLQAECAGEPDVFADRWTAAAASFRFDELNRLIEQHNDWYPIERDLPMNPRTGDYVPVGGRPYRRRVLDREWVFEEFPPVLGEET
jgi:glutathione S-transferase